MRQYIFHESNSAVKATSYELPVIAKMCETDSEHAVFPPVSIFYKYINYIVTFKQLTQTHTNVYRCIDRSFYLVVYEIMY